MDKDLTYSKVIVADVSTSAKQTEMTVLLQSILLQIEVNKEVLIESKKTNKYFELIYGDVVIDSDIDN